MTSALPPVYVTTRDFGRLEHLAHAGDGTQHPVAEFLAAELNRAVVCPPDYPPFHFVTMNSCVMFQIEPREEVESRILVYPDQYQPAGQHISIMSPIGVALLGLRVGDRMPFTDLQGRHFSAVLKRISHRPEPQGEYALRKQEPAADLVAPDAPNPAEGRPIVVPFRARPTRNWPGPDRDPDPDNAA